MIGELNEDVARAKHHHCKQAGSKVCFAWSSLLRSMQEWNKGPDYEKEDGLFGKSFA